ncbi:MAG: sugar ABC transporter permease, partial [Hyphomicrobiales bacterium]|nr:sugar ABC transporter permease [Hyphomicrobiales bacterium]
MKARDSLPLAFLRSARVNGDVTPGEAREASLGKGDDATPQSHGFPSPRVPSERSAGSDSGGDARPATPYDFSRKYWAFAIPAVIAILAVIVFPWLFTLYMSVEEWHVGGDITFAGLANYRRLLGDERFLWSVVRTIYFTVLAVAFPMLLGIAAAVTFHRKFPFRGLARTIF